MRAGKVELLYCLFFVLYRGNLIVEERNSTIPFAS
jgi:hypothetical protein